MEAILRRGLEALGLGAEGVPSLLRYAALLEERNRVMNLTAITDPEDVATLHFLDCASLLPLADFRGHTLADVGTGAGFPGLVLRILEPTLSVTLLDAQNKRIDFLRDVCSDLALTDVSCVHARAETFASDHRESFDFVTSRAVADLRILSELCLPLVRPDGAFLAMKSVDSDAELSAARHAIGLLGGQIETVLNYTIPCTDVTHRLVVVRKTAPTPTKYPRSFAKIKKNPL